jgi:hypothetical protein
MLTKYSWVITIGELPSEIYSRITAYKIHQRIKQTIN